MADDARCAYCEHGRGRKQAYISGGAMDGIVSLIAWPDDLLDSVPYERRGHMLCQLTRSDMELDSPHASAGGPWLVAMVFQDSGLCAGCYAVDISFCPFCGRDLRGEGA